MQKKSPSKILNKVLPVKEMWFLFVLVGEVGVKNIRGSKQILLVPKCVGLLYFLEKP